MAEDKKIAFDVGGEAKDINQNVGSFSCDVVPAITEPEKKLEATKKIKTEQVNQQPEINFEKFSKTKKKRFFKEKGAKSSFGVKVETWLANKKKLGLIWAVIGTFLSILYTFSIFFITYGSNVLGNCANSPLAPNYPGVSFNKMLQAGVAMSYIVIILLSLPIIYLIISWFVGINGVYYSRLFHYVFWSIILFCVILFVINSICCWIPFAEFWSFQQYVPKLFII